MIKKLRKLSNATVLCLTSNKSVQGSIQSLSNNIKEIIYMEEFNSDVLSKSFDIMIIDYSLKGSVELMNEVRVLKPLLPKIVILSESSEKAIINCINSGAYTIITTPEDVDQLKISLIMALNQSKRVDKICLDNGIYYDAYRERFYNNFGEISFTKFEFKVLKLLLDRSDRVVTYDDIKENVWKEKKMSIFTMRNVINKIRNKTYYNIIKNNSSQGYQIDTPR